MIIGESEYIYLMKCPIFRYLYSFVYVVMYVTHLFKMSQMSANYIVGKVAIYDQKSFLHIFRF